MKKRLAFLTAMFLMVSLLFSACAAEAPGAQASTGSSSVSEPAPSSAPAPADDYPKKPVTIILQFAAGGGGDQYLLALKPYLEKYLGTTVLIDYKPGASAQIGNEYLYQSEPDGYTIGFMSTPHIYISQLTQDTSYTFEDFYPIARHCMDGVIFYTLKDSEIKTFDDMLEAAKAKPGELTVASGSLASDFGICIKTVEASAGVQFGFIPTEGGAQTLQGVLGGHFTVGVHRPASALGAKDQLNGLCVFSEKRDPSWPEVPTIYEVMPDLDLPPMGSAKGLICTTAFKEQYPERFQKLVDAAKQAAEDPEFIETAERMGLQLDYVGPEKARESMYADFELYSQYKDILSGN